ncbi:WecB/TagA/CpsF family glycosyltransferase [Vibrio sp. EA2]|uniref:WecB/TagA/CpsF family glycosyltransferase n=1 Tax=Vibrio sp. EA2 TaxID=3079860 RepID=UPI0029490BBB|nr:WecB/TagA/CpsF family glycosyltransferase [Vibrio sp. EA2]MDV6253345.1 WecB/TagA/CpsF family glycosyltransferase [Vibrio sp. EA2]
MYSPTVELKMKDKKFLLSILNEPTIVSPLAISFVNPFSYKHASITNCAKDIDFWFSDGALLCHLTNIFRRKDKINRVSFDFSSIAHDVFRYANQESKRVAIIGGTDDEINKAINYISTLYPSVNFVYKRNGYFSESEMLKIAKEISFVNPDYVVAGLGTPLQEEFIVSVKMLLEKKCILFTCGGFITQTASKGDFYHPLVKKFGVRWLQRAIEQKHVRKRILKDYPIFIVSYMTSSLVHFIRK